MKSNLLVSLFIFMLPLWAFAEDVNDQRGRYQAVILEKHNEANNSLKNSEKSTGLLDQTNTDIQSQSEIESPKTSSIERWVQPLTRWAEDQIRDTPLVRSPNKKNLKSKPSSINLRDAIRIAKKEYPGMVLGAEPKTLDGILRYEVRIISQNGVIKTVSVFSSDEQEGLISHDGVAEMKEAKP